MTRFRVDFLGVATLVCTLSAGVFSGCGTADPPILPERVWTPEELVTAMLPAGTEVSLRGKVTALTFPSMWRKDDEVVALPTRYLLLDAGAEPNRLTDGWGLGVTLPPERLRRREWLPAQVGEEVQVRGKVATLLWDAEQRPRPILDPVSEYTIVTRGPTQKDLGLPCQQDMDCADDLWCERRSLTCVPPPELTWNSELANINGSCQTDADCPAAQRCDLGYRILRTGPYSVHYAVDRDVGRGLCQVDRKAPPAQSCPRTVSAEDLLGGRFPTGKELCTRVRITFPIVSPGDRDTHVQAAIAFPGRFPQTVPSLDPFGAALENVPPYKDPSNPIGALLDPLTDEWVEILGTVHFDDSHGWWEVHPIKWLRKVSPP